MSPNRFSTVERTAARLTGRGERIIRIVATPEGRQAEEMVVRVQCYAGWKANERPVRFQLGGREYLIEEVLDQWYGPDDTFFKVRTDDGNFYTLRHGSASG